MNVKLNIDCIHRRLLIVLLILGVTTCGERERGAGARGRV